MLRLLPLLLLLLLYGASFKKKESQNESHTDIFNFGVEFADVFCLFLSLNPHRRSGGALVVGDRLRHRNHQLVDVTSSAVVMVVSK